MLSYVPRLVLLFFGFLTIVSCGEATVPATSVTPEDVRAEYAAKCSVSLEAKDLIPCEVGAVLRVDLSTEVKYSCGLVLMEHIRSNFDDFPSRSFTYPPSDDEVIAWSHIIETDIDSLKEDLTPLRIEFLIDDFERPTGHNAWQKICAEQYTAVYCSAQIFCQAL